MHRQVSFDVPIYHLSKCNLETCLSATSCKIWTFSAFLYIAETISTNFVKISSHNLHNLYNKYTLFTGWEVRIMRNCAQGLESAARRCRPRAVLRPRAQFLPIRTDVGRWITFSFFSQWDLKVSGKFYLSLQLMFVEAGRVRVDVYTCNSKRAIDCKPKQNMTTWF